MEYPFKDLLPLDEVLEREGYYKDWTHLDPEVFYSLTQISNFIKTKGYGVDVRLLIAQLAEHFGLKTTQVVDLANLLQQKFTNLEGVTQSFTSNINSLVAQMEADKDAVIANATVDSEVILARGGSPTLQARLDDTTTQVAHDIEYSSKSTYNYLGSGKKEKKVIVSFIADDAPKNDLTRLLPIMQEKQIPVGIGVVTDFVGKVINTSSYNNEEFMSWDDLRHMQKNGAEIMAHSHTHVNMTSINEEEREIEMGLCHKILSENGFVVDGFIYPYNALNGTTIKTAKKHYKYSFARNSSNSPKIDNNRINRYSLGSFYDQANKSVKGYDTSSLEYYKERVDIAVEKEEWLVFVLHTYANNFDSTQQQYLRETIDYIRSLGIEIVSPREGFETYGNLVQIEDGLTITASGNVEMNKPHNRYTISTHIDIPNQTTNYDLNIIDFNWSEYPNHKTINRNAENGIFEINDAGLYLIEYGLLLELEVGAFATASLSTQGFSLAGVPSDWKEKHQSFDEGRLVGAGVVKRFPLTGQAVVYFNPAAMSRFDCRLSLHIRNQSTTEINRVRAYQDTSHLSITKL